MTSRYKSSAELTEKYIKDGASVTTAQRDAWISLRAKEIMQENNYDDNDDDRFMARNEAEAEYNRSVPSAIENARLTRESMDRYRAEIAAAQRASATVQNNSSVTPVGKLEAVVPGKVFKDTRGRFYDPKGKPLSHEEVAKLNLAHVNAQQAAKEMAERNARQAAAIKLREENERKKREKEAEDKNPEALKKYIKSTQSLLFNKMGQVFGSERSSYFPGPEKIYRIPAEGKRGGTFTQRLSTQELFGTGKGSFLQATPAQLGSLMPLLRFYIVDTEGNQKEIFFSDKVSADHIKKIANLKGKSIDDIINYNAKGGGETGIQSFTWNYNNKHEGDFIIDAELELYFGTLADLANVEYLQFLFPTGNEVELAEELDLTAQTTRQTNISQGRNLSAQAARSQLLTKLKEKIGNYDLLKNGNADLKKVVAGNKKLLGEAKKNFRQLKVVVGWSFPEGNDTQLAKLFPNGGLASFKNEIRNTHTAIILNLADYNVNFTQEGPTTLSLRYVGSSDNYLAQDSSDIFGSNNFEAAVMTRDTEVSLEGILEQDNILTDSVSATGARTKKAGLNPLKIVKSDPYLGKVFVRGKRDAFGERTATVQLLGLRLAQELVDLELKLQQAQSTDPEDPKIKFLRRRGQYLTLLYNRALNIRLRTMYSTFIEKMIDRKIVKIGAVDIERKNGKGKVKLTTNPKEIAKRRTVKRVINASERAFKAALDADVKVTSAGTAFAKAFQFALRAVDREVKAERQRSGDESESFDVYYVFLGDIIRTMMASADLRDDITLLLGNFEDINGNTYPIYKIPITLESFGEFFFNRIVSRKLKAYPFRTFLNDFLNFTARIINLNSQTSERISFDYTMYSSTYRDVKAGPTRLISNEDIKSIRLGVHNPLSSTRLAAKTQSYYAVFAKKTSFGRRTGSFAQDQKDGIFHYMLGSDRGLAKQFNFSRQETDYFQEMLIESNNPSDKIQALFLPQNVNIEMYGNGIHRNGDLIFVDTRAALGDFASQVLGIGGYYRVVRSTHKITNRGYVTSLTCVFELRAGKKKNGTSN